MTAVDGSLAPLVLRATSAGRTLWLAPEAPVAWQGGLPEASDEGAAADARGGRGPLVVAAWRDGRALVKTHRRGGALARLLPDAFLLSRRARDEVRALARLSRDGLAPAVLALEIRGGILKRLRVAMAEVPGEDLSRLCARDEAAVRDVELARAVGAAVAAMHDAGVAHRDLNASNVIVCRLGGIARVTLVDFEGATIGDGPVGRRRRRRDVLRLCRSIDKWSVLASAPAGVRAAFLRAALPTGERRATLRAARRRQRVRWLLQRRGPKTLPARPS